MPRLLPVSLIVWFALSCAFAFSQDPAPADPIQAAAAHADRPKEDKDRDGDRKPVELLRFFGVRPGMKVGDLMAGGGYFTELLSRIVGEGGAVYAQNNKTALERFANAAMTKRLENGRLPNVTRLDRELEDPGLPEGELDAVFLVLFYHDTYWMKVDRAEMNKRVFDALKPGGTYAVIDHHAAAGSGTRDVQTLHRVDAELVKKEILAAGFELAEESTLLAHPEDDRTRNVFTPGLRGKTDQFVFKFRKPG